MESKLTRLRRIDVDGPECLHQLSGLSGDITAYNKWDKCFLYVFFKGRRLAYWSIPVSDLLYSPAQFKSRLVESLEDGGLGSSTTVKYTGARMCCAQWKQFIYLLGCVDSIMRFEARASFLMESPIHIVKEQKKDLTPPHERNLMHSSLSPSPRKEDITGDPTPMYGIKGEERRSISISIEIRTRIFREVRRRISQQLFGTSTSQVKKGESSYTSQVEKGESSYVSIDKKRDRHKGESSSLSHPIVEEGKGSLMHSEKGAIFISMEHNDIIYVLSDFFVKLPEYTFECYNPKEDTWYILESPPFHHPGSQYYTNTADFSYVIIKKKICVSAKKASFAYDLDAKEWEPCYLFENFSSSSRQSGVGATPLPKLWSWADYAPSNISKEPKGGPPFEFVGKGLIYGNDCLICMIPYQHDSLMSKACYQRSVMGYCIDSERVVKKQLLFNFAEVVDGIFNGGLLVELGSGYFSLTYTRSIESSAALVIQTFKVSRLTEASEDRFLDLEIFSLHVIGVDKDDDYFPHFSFKV